MQNDGVRKVRWTVMSFIMKMWSVGPFDDVTTVFGCSCNINYLSVMKGGEPGVNMTQIVIVASKTSLTVNTLGFGGVYCWRF